MEEDIEILEGLVNGIKKYGFDYDIDGEQHDSINFEEFKAIENLINRNKELEEELNSVKEIYYTQKEIETDYIPKSKVKEKIEELNDYDSKFCQRVLDHNEHTLTELIQNILQELLEE